MVYVQNAMEEIMNRERRNVMRIGFRFMISGDRFSPSQFEDHTGLFLKNKEEIGDVITRGPNKGKLNSLGNARLYPPDDVLDDEKYCIRELDQEKEILQTMVNDLYHYKDKLYKELGIEEIYLDYVVYSNGDVLLSFDPEILKKLGEMNIAIWFSCYEDY